MITPQEGALIAISAALNLAKTMTDALSKYVDAEKENVNKKNNDEALIKATRDIIDEAEHFRECFCEYSLAPQKSKMKRLDGTEY